MGSSSGLAAQLMCAEEVTYGTAVPPTRSYEFVNETLKLAQPRIESKGLRAGRRVLTTGKWVPGLRSAGGDVLMEVAGTGFGLWLKHMFGSIATTGAAGVFTHTATPGDLPVGMTVQVGRPSIDGTVQPFNYLGCRVNGWELALKAGELLSLKLTLAAQDELPLPALGAFVDPTSVPLSFAGAQISVGGTTVDLLDFNLKAANSLDASRGRIRSAFTVKQPLENNWREYTGQLTADFESLVQYNHFVAADEMAFTATFLGGIISAGTHFGLVVSGNIRYDGQTPNVAGPGLLQQVIPIKFIASGAADSSGITAAYTTSDVLP